MAGVNTDYKTSDLEEMRFQNRLKNLTESGELEPNPEDLDTFANADRPKYHVFNSASEKEFFDRVNRLDFLKGVYFVENPDKKDDIRKSEVWQAFNFETKAKNGNGGIKFSEQEALYFNKELKAEHMQERETQQINFKLEQTEQKPSSAIQYTEGVRVDFKLLGSFIVEGWKAIASFIDFKSIKEAFTGVFEEFFGKKEKKAMANIEQDPQKAAQIAEQNRRNANIRQNVEAQKAQMSSMSEEMKKAQEEEAKNINTVAKIGQALYKGVRDGFGRITSYARTLFERGQLEAEIEKKKAEKEASLKQATKQADGASDVARLDKVDGQSGIVGANASAG